MSFGVPMIWIDPREHDPAECYVCVNYIDGMNRRKSDSLKYIPITYTQLPLPHSNAIPVPTKLISTEQSELLALKTMKIEEAGVSLNY